MPNTLSPQAQNQLRTLIQDDRRLRREIRGIPSQQSQAQIIDEASQIAAERINDLTQSAREYTANFSLQPWETEVQVPAPSQTGNASGTRSPRFIDDTDDPYRSISGGTLTANSLNAVVTTTYGATTQEKTITRGQQRTIEEQAVLIFDILKEAAYIGGKQKGKLTNENLVRLTQEIISQLPQEDRVTILSMNVEHNSTVSTPVGSFVNTSGQPVYVIVQEQ